MVYMTKAELSYMMDQSASEFGLSEVDGNSFTMEYTTQGGRSTAVLDYGMGSFAHEFKVPPTRYPPPPPPPPAARRPPPATRHPPATPAPPT